MFMRRQLKQGNLFQLDKRSNDEQQMFSANNFETVESGQLEGQIPHIKKKIRNEPPNFTDFSVQQIAGQNSTAVACCGAIICFLCMAIGLILFYFVLFDYVKDYIPFIPHQQNLQFLTQTNAKQYFAKNQIIAGEFHYARVPVEYWGHRIEMIKSMGMNALSVNVFWNYHQISKGKFDFQTKNKNLTYFLELCKQHQMNILLRPGPYVGAEWDFGGLPARLLAVEGLKIRSSDSLFIDQTRIYFQHLSKFMKKYIRNKQNNDGPILMLQVQNQPGKYTQQVLYIQKLKKLWDGIKIDCPLYFSQTKENLDNHKLYWDNAIIGINPLMYNSKDFDSSANKSHFIFAGQISAGWPTTWGGQEPSQKEPKGRDKDNFIKQISQLLSDNRSFSLSMAHGGTNFGLTAGFNSITSYDYFAPVDQQGSATSNYHAFRSLILNYTKKVPPTIPSPKQAMSVTFGQLVPISSLFDNLPNSIPSLDSQTPLLFQSNELQMFHQGMVMYETKIMGPNQYKFEAIIHDVGLIFVDGQYIQTVVRKNKNQSLEEKNKQITIECKNKFCKLSILVEAMGHVNHGLQMNVDRKGILKFVQKGQQFPLILKWKHYKFEVADEPQWKNTQKCEKAPCLYYIQADLSQAKDTYINVKDLKKGYVWVNGYNLGRYWDIAPQYKLYCPGVWLNKGKNKILVLDLYVANATATIKGQNKLS